MINEPQGRQIFPDPLRGRGGANGAGDVPLLQKGQELPDPGLGFHTMLVYISIHQLDPLGFHLLIIHLGAKVALQLPGGLVPVQGPQTQGVVPGHGIAQRLGGLLPEAAVELFRVQNQPVHVKQNGPDGPGLKPGLQNFKGHGGSSFLIDYAKMLNKNDREMII